MSYTRTPLPASFPSGLDGANLPKSWVHGDAPGGQCPVEPLDREQQVPSIQGINQTVCTFSDRIALGDSRGRHDVQRCGHNDYAFVFVRIVNCGVVGAATSVGVSTGVGNDAWCSQRRAM